MRSYRATGIIIKRRNFLEKDRILTLFTSEKGKIEVLAKGARRPGNRLSANSDLAIAAKFHIHHAKSLDIATEIEPTFHPDGIRGQFDKTQKVSYALKIIDKLFEPDQAHPKTYQILVFLIKSLSVTQRQLIFMKFLIEIMADLGTLPSFMNCPVCHKSIGESDEFEFNFQGGLTHKNCSEGGCLKIDKNQVKLLRLIEKTSLDQISTMKIDEKVYVETYKILLKYFNSEFGNILPDEVL